MGSPLTQGLGDEVICPAADCHHKFIVNSEHFQKPPEWGFVFCPKCRWRFMLSPLHLPDNFSDVVPG
eukprot:g20689.t1